MPPHAPDDAGDQRGVQHGININRSVEKWGLRGLRHGVPLKRGHVRIQGVHPAGHRTGGGSHNKPYLKPFFNSSTEVRPPPTLRLRAVSHGKALPENCVGGFAIRFSSIIIITVCTLVLTNSPALLAITLPKCNIAASYTCTH